MENTTRVTNPIRTDEATFLVAVPKIISGAAVLRVGRFLTGDVGNFGAAYAVLLWPYGDFSTHMIVADDQRVPGELIWYAVSGNYFTTLGDAQDNLGER